MLMEKANEHFLATYKSTKDAFLLSVSSLSLSLLLGCVVHFRLLVRSFFYSIDLRSVGKTHRGSPGPTAQILPPLSSSVRLLGRRALRKHCTARASALLYPYIRHRQVPSKGEQKRERGKRKKKRKEKISSPCIWHACTHAMHC